MSGGPYAKKASDWFRWAPLCRISQASSRIRHPRQPTVAESPWPPEKLRPTRLLHPRRLRTLLCRPHRGRVAERVEDIECLVIRSALGFRVAKGLGLRILSCYENQECPLADSRQSPSCSAECGDSTSNRRAVEPFAPDGSQSRKPKATTFPPPALSSA